MVRPASPKSRSTSSEGKPVLLERDPRCLQLRNCSKYDQLCITGLGPRSILRCEMSASRPPYSQANGRRSQSGVRGDAPDVASQNHEQVVGYLQTMWKRTCTQLEQSQQATAACDGNYRSVVYYQEKEPDETRR
ncbi:uncharacterized protein [Dermacentor albipictus]|uniref:uncharacterized protein isoform X3 n=1 Tax=Dermacentor albipictus TaxID=60249 RepID=UPI0038FBFA2B